MCWTLIQVLYSSTLTHQEGVNRSVNWGKESTYPLSTGQLSTDCIRALLGITLVLSSVFHIFPSNILGATTISNLVEFSVDRIFFCASVITGSSKLPVSFPRFSSQTQSPSWNAFQEYEKIWRGSTFNGRHAFLLNCHVWKCFHFSGIKSHILTLYLYSNVILKNNPFFCRLQTGPVRFPYKSNLLLLINQLRFEHLGNGTRGNLAPVLFPGGIH